MKQFACGDVVPGCDATFTAPGDAGILDLVAVHAREAHGLSEIEPDLIEQVVGRIRVA